MCGQEKQCLWHESRQGYGDRDTTGGREAHEVSLIGSWARRGGPQSQDSNKMHPNESSKEATYREIQRGGAPKAWG